MRRQTEDLDQEKEGNLMLWLAQKHPKIKTLQEVWRSQIILELLLSIDKQHFAPLKAQTELTVSAVFQFVEVYINEYLGKRLNRKLKSSITCPSSLIRLCQLILFISVYSNNKKKFIEHILSLPTPIQTYLMTVIDNINQSIYAMDVTEILEKINSLEIQNEKLEDQIEEKNQKYRSLWKQYQIVQLDLESMQKQVQTLKKEKTNLFKEFEIDSIEEYADIYRQLHSQYTQTVKCLIRSEQKERSLCSDVANSKLKILEDNKLIAQLYEEIDSLKAICRNLRGYPIPQFLQDQPFSPESQNILKQNKTFGNSGGISPIKQLNKKHSKLFTQSNEELQQEISKLKNQIEQLNSKLQNCHEVIESQKQIISCYKNDAIELKKCNQIRRWKLQELQSIHSDLSRLVLTKNY